MTRMDPEDARQGKKGTPVLKVLIAALILCAIVAIGLVFFAKSTPEQAISSPSASSTSAPASNDATTTPTPATPAPAN